MVRTKWERETQLRLRHTMTKAATLLVHVLSDTACRAD